MTQNLKNMIFIGLCILTIHIRLGEVPTNTIEAYAMAFLYIVAYGLFIYYYIKP